MKKILLHKIVVRIHKANDEVHLDLQLSFLGRHDVKANVKARKDAVYMRNIEPRQLKVQLS